MRNDNPLQMDNRPWGIDLKTFTMLMHLSLLTGLIPGLNIVGIVLPIIMWATNKEEFPEIDTHGKIILNWILSCIIYAFIAGILTLVLVGIPLLIALGICHLIFVINGALKAQKGEVYTYPMSFIFFR